MGMPEESQPIDYRKDVIMKKHRIISDEAEEDIFDSDLDDLEDFVPVEKEEAKPSSQTKVRRGYIPLKFHSHDEAEEA